MNNLSDILSLEKSRLGILISCVFLNKDERQVEIILLKMITTFYYSVWTHLDNIKLNKLHIVACTFIVLCDFKCLTTCKFVCFM